MTESSFIKIPSQKKDVFFEGGRSLAPDEIPAQWGAVFSICALFGFMVSLQYIEKLLE